MNPDPTGKILMELREAINTELSSRLDELKGIIPTRLHNAMKYSLMAPGKRLRPCLAVLTASALKNITPSHSNNEFRELLELILPAAGALEIIHTYSLIHDDLPCMDDDSMRRGRPTLHVKYDEATAILTGDALHSMAFSVVARSQLEPEKKCEIVAILSRAAGAQGMVGGQLLDISFEKEGLKDIDLKKKEKQLLKMHLLKTGALFTAATLIGAIFAGAEKEDRKVIEKYGEKLGLLFQITDDILDRESSSKILGKTAGKDKKQKKLTFVSVYGLEKSKEKALSTYTDIIATLTPLGDRARWLMELARIILERKK